MWKKEYKTTRKLWREKNIEKINEQRRKIYHERSVELNQKRRDRRKNDPEYRERMINSAKHSYQNHKEVYTKWRLRNKDIINHQSRLRNKKIKLEVLNYYSNGLMKCKCCDELELDFLSIDHIDGGGKRMQKIQGMDTGLYKWLKRNEFPEGFQVLCMNCNFAKGKRGVCPHQLQKTLAAVAD